MGDHRGRTLLGVAGFPVAHSRSPDMHNAALRALGLDWLYVPVPVPPELFAETVRALPASGFRGVNVTVPHKEAAHGIADVRSPAVTAIGAANTLTFDGEVLRADNTDAVGFIDSLGESPRGLRALVLGAGGSARAVVWALREAGADVSLCNRTPARAEKLAAELEVRHVRRPTSSDLLVHCTSLGLDPGTSGAQAIEMVGRRGLDPPPTVVDLVYADTETPVTAWARTGGARVIGGIEVLVRQGARSLELWTGRPAPVAEMRAAVEGPRG
ncbi:MAG: shikimate dehydrogenase [Thermoleophilaceae bacterium]|nr:shikimate dehydrogenase [Thermoleophilaceae bacterium]